MAKGHATPLNVPPDGAAVSPEAREGQLISLAVNLAEQQLRDGTASSQVIVHFLKLGCMHEKAELEKLQLEKELLKAKTENIRLQAESGELYNDALKAFRGYVSTSTIDE